MYFTGEWYVKSYKENDILSTLLYSFLFREVIGFMERTMYMESQESWILV